MKIQDVQLLYEYNYWANGQILTTAAQVSEDAFQAPGPFSYGGLRGTLVHALEAEMSWRILIQHNEFMPELNVDDFPTVEVLAQKWREEEKTMRQYLASLNDDDMTSIIRYRVAEGRRERVLWHCLVHIVNHGTQHRSEAAMLLTDLGYSPGDLGFRYFTEEVR